MGEWTALCLASGLCCCRRERTRTDSGHTEQRTHQTHQQRTKRANFELVPRPAVAPSNEKGRKYHIGNGAADDKATDD